MCKVQVVVGISTSFLISVVVSKDYPHPDDHTIQTTYKHCQPKGVTIQMKAPDEYILMELFVPVLKRVHFLAVFCLFWMEEQSNERI